MTSIAPRSRGEGGPGWTARRPSWAPMAIRWPLWSVSGRTARATAATGRFGRGRVLQAVPQWLAKPIRSALSTCQIHKRGPVMNPRGAFLATLAVALLVASGSARGQCFTEFRASPGSGPEDITAGADGNVWFTEFDSGSIA